MTNEAVVDAADGRMCVPGLHTLGSKSLSIATSPLQHYVFMETSDAEDGADGNPKARWVFQNELPYLIK